MEILFVSDYVCPYCLVAKEALKQAMSRSGLTPAITWHPFELTREPQPQVDTYHDERRKAGYQVLVEPCKKLDLDMKLPPKVIPRPYSRLAFEGWHYACDHGKGEEYNDLMYRAYFIDELDIGSIEVLSALAAQVGLDAADFRAALESGAYYAQEKAAAERARAELKVAHVPTIFIDGREVTLEKYTAEEMLAILIDGAAQSSGSFCGCGPEGC